MKISYYLPDSTLDNTDLEMFGWSADKIYDKTGIRRRHISGSDEFALDLAIGAPNRLFHEHGVDKSKIDFLVYCSQSPDFIVPNNASILQQRLGLSSNLGSFDINQGCTGFLYGLSVAKGLLVSKQAKQILLVTADTWSKYIHDKDRSTRTIFGDGASATYLSQEDAEKIGDFVYGTDGGGAQNLWVKTSGLRFPRGEYPVVERADASGNIRSDNNLFMNGPEVFNFTLKRVPEAVNELLVKSRLSMDDIDHFVFHQANGFMLERLRQKLNIPREKFRVQLESVGNTVSSTIPIVLSSLFEEEKLRAGQRVLLVGYGVGYSWISTIYTV